MMQFLHLVLTFCYTHELKHKQKIFLSCSLEIEVANLVSSSQLHLKTLLFSQVPTTIWVLINLPGGKKEKKEISHDLPEIPL